jgi:hypothetical protein
MTWFRAVLVGALGGLVAPALCAVPPSSAAPPEFETISETFVNRIDHYCDVDGLSVVSTGTFESVLKVRTAGSGVQYFLEHTTLRERVTGVASGHSVTIETSTLSKDLKITDNGDGAPTIIALLTGPSSVYGPDGKAIARNPGQVRFRIVISDGGTPSNPDDDVELSFEQVKGSTGRSDDYCAAIVDVLG